MYSGFGTTIIGQYFSSDKNKSSDYSITLDFGKFKGKALESNDLIAFDRYGVNASLSKEFRLASFIKNKDIFDKTFKYSPEVVDQGVYISSALKGGLYEYGNGDSQSVLSLSIGPELKIGEFRKRFWTIRIYL